MQILGKSLDWYQKVGYRENPTMVARGHLLALCWRIQPLSHIRTISAQIQQIAFEVTRPEIEKVVLPCRFDVFWELYNSA
jgi:hypothetical protein